MTFRLEIPASAFEVKASYFERPDKATVKLIHEFIKQFGTPHLWWGHTHNPPPKGSRVTFLGKYSLPKTHHRRAKWAPCPCCSPHSPKYFRQGLIAWFPDEGIIRCVGDQCYKKMDPEGYALAMDQLNAEIADQQTAEFLLGRIPNIPEVATPPKKKGGTLCRPPRNNAPRTILEAHFLAFGTFATTLPSMPF